jgi:hypothetical protein
MIIDKELLKKQIKVLLESNLDEDTKSGLHNLLGEILDETETREERFREIERHLKGLEIAINKIKGE